jgi:tetratricopeptide (TPR) repeat protein
MVAAEASRDDLTFAKTAEGLGFIEMMLGHTREAGDWLNLGDAVLERISARNSIVAAWLLNERGCLDYALGDFSGAETALRSAISLKASILGARHPDVAASETNLAIVLAEMDRCTEALPIAQDAIAILEQSGGGGGLAFANNLQTLADVLIRVGRLDEAEQVLQRALAIERDSGEDTVALAMTLASRAELLLLRRRPDQAVAVANQALAVEQRLDERDPIRLATTSFVLGRALVASGGDAARGRQMVAGACHAFETHRFQLRERQTIAWFNALPERRHPVSSCAELSVGGQQPRHADVQPARQQTEDRR